VESRELAYDGKGARQVRPPQARREGGRWVKRWDPVWIRIGEQWRVGILKIWIRPEAGAPWLAQVEYCEPATVAGWCLDFFVYDPKFIRPLGATAPPEP
jgi:hypothetical protein